MIVQVAVTLLLLSSFQKSNCEEMCQTVSCLETAVRVLKSMNETVQPCDDFFEFACRGWITNNPIPNHEVSWNTLKVIEDEIELRLYTILDTPDKEEDGRPIKMARAFYRSCMDSKSVENVGFKPLIDAFTKLGLPMSPPTDEQAAHLDIPKIAGLALRHYGITFFVGPAINQDLNNSSMHRLVLQKVPLDSENLGVYLRDPIRFNTTVKAQKHYIQGMMVLAGMKEKTETEYANETMNFMIELAKIMATPEERASNNYAQHVMTIWELQNLTDPHAKHWNWTTYMNAMFDKTDVIVDPKNDTVHVVDMGYFKGLPLLLSKTSRGMIARYAWWEVYSWVAPQTRQAFRDWGAHFKKQAHGFGFDPLTCMENVKHFFKMALTAAYVKKHFNVQNKKTAMEIWTNVISSFDEMLTEYKWIDGKTKAQAHRKLRTMIPLIAYPEWIMDPKKLEEHYKEYEVLERSLVHTYTNFESIERKRLFNSWRQKPDRNKWETSVTDVGAYHSPSLNRIKNVYHEYRLAITAGILHEPLHGNAAQALNYGAIGALMGHEITHGFDKFGQQYDENTTVRNWWSKEDLKHYKEKVDCVIKQYSGYAVPQLGKSYKLGGIHTEGENVADIGGLAMAFKAYKKLKARSQPQQAIAGLAKYTDEQLFFLGYAQMWCDSFTDAALKRFIKLYPRSPGRFRIIGALRNSAEFAKAWNCPSGSPMNPEQKCTVW